MPRADGALKEMERNGETQNRRSGSRVGVNNCWGRSSVKGSVERIYLRQHHQHHDDEYGKSQQEQPGRGNCPPRHAAMFRQPPAEVNPPKETLVGGNPRLASKLNWEACDARPIAEASVALCCRIAPGFLVLFARRSRAIRDQSRKLTIHESRGPIDWRKPYFPNQVGSRFDPELV